MGDLSGCIFCNARADSREHLWGEWIVKGVDRISIEWQQIGRPDKMWSGPKANPKVRSVCGKCNTTWMSDLENTAKPILVPMFRGEAIDLNVHQQVTIANWATKTAMIFDSTRAGDRFFEYDDTHYLYTNSEPPKTVRCIWLCKYEGNAHDGFAIGTDLMGIVEGNDSDVAGYSTTFGVGKLVVQLLAVRHEHDITWPIVQLTDVTDKAGLILPFAIPTSSWPPAVALDDDANSVEQFSRRFTGATGESS